MLGGACWAGSGAGAGARRPSRITIWSSANDDMKHTLLVLCALMILLGCGPVAAEQPTAQPTQPALAPIVPAPAEPTSANTPEPAPTVATTGEGLTGRLLFVQNGNLW